MDENKRVIGLVTADNPQNITGVPQRPMLVPSFPMMQQMQAGQMPFPLLFFLFPRVAMMLVTVRGNFNSGQGGVGVQHITELVRDKAGRVIQIIEMTK